MAILILKNLCRMGRDRFSRSNFQAQATAALVLVLLFSPGFFSNGYSQPISREYPLKAVFLFNFTQFTAWPSNSFVETNSPFVIGILGDDPFGPVLDETLQAESWNGHQFVVRRDVKLGNVNACHLLFVSRSEVKKLPAIAASLKGKPILTVADFDNPESRDIMIQLYTEKNRIRFKINLDLLKDSNLAMSSKLLRVAKVETSENK